MANGFFIPETIDPDSEVCVQFKFPNDPLYRQMVRGHIWQLGYSTFWGRTSETDERSQEVSQLFLNSLLDTLEFKNDCDEVGTGLGSCFRLDTTTDAFSYYPNDPFTDPQNSERPPVFTGMKWKRFAEIGFNSLPFVGEAVQDAVELGTGYFPNDIMLTIDPFEVLNPIERLRDFIGAFTQFPFPYVRIELEGSGQIEIEVLNVPYGCIVMLVPDLPLNVDNTIDFDDIFETIMGFIDDGISIPKGWISLNLDRKLPIQLFVSQIQEFEFPEDGVHTLHAFFCPRPSILPPFLNPFGGIREIEACGDIKIVGVTSGKSISKLNFKLPEVKREGVYGVAIDTDLKDTMLCVAEEVARRVAFGAVDDIYKDDIQLSKDDGSITKVPSFGGNKAELPSSVTPIEESRGGYVAIGEGFRDIVGTIVTRRTAGDVIAKVVTRLRRGFEFITGAEGVTDPLFTVIDTYFEPLSATPAVLPETVANFVQCAGNFRQGLLQYIQDVEDNDATNGETFAIFYEQLLSQITDTQLDAWYVAGTQVPRLTFAQAPCYRFDPQTVEITSPSQTANTTIFTQGGGARLWRAEISGKLTDNLGRTYDGMYHTDENGNREYRPMKLYRTGGAPENSPLAQPAFSNEGYSAEYSLGSNLVGYRLLYAPDVMTAPVTGTITLTVYDLGVI